MSAISRAAKMIPTVLMWRGGDGEIVTVETAAEPHMCRDVEYAVARLRAGKAAMVRDDDAAAVLAALVAGAGEEAQL